MKVALTVGNIEYALVPYSDDPSTRKHRPVVILGWSKMGWGQDESILVVPITSYDGVPKPRDGDVRLDWRAAGLAKDSWARARRVWGAHPHAFSTTKTSPGAISDNELRLIYIEIEALFK